MSGAEDDCEEENVSQHYLGEDAGFGPVRNSELLVYAVFEATKRDQSTGRLLKEAFPTKDLVRTEVSVAREAFTNQNDIHTYVVTPALERMGALVGVTMATAESIRAIKFSVPNLTPAVSKRAFCVLDKVSRYDFAGHAAIGYSESESSLNQKQKQVVRELIRADLAVAFGQILTIETAYSR